MPPTRCIILHPAGERQPVALPAKVGHDSRSTAQHHHGSVLRHLLDANRLWDQRNGLEPGTTEDSGFRLVSRRIQREFITIWGLFGQPEELTATVNELARQARAIFRTSPYEAIVTSTPAAKRILDYAHALIETDDVRINVDYLGHYPYMSTDTKLLSLHDRGVLVITDVVATGTLLRHLFAVVEQLGGRVVAALALVITDPAMVACQHETGQPPQLPVGADSAAIHSLTDYRIPPLPVSVNPGLKADGSSNVETERLRSTYDPGKVIDIDSGTVFPEEIRENPAVRPLLSRSLMYELLEDADAIDFRLFQSGNSRFMTGVRVDSLLTHPASQEAIWKATRPLLAPDPHLGDPVVISTFDRQDLRFRDFINRRLDTEGYTTEYITLSRGEQVDTAYQYFLTRDLDARKVAGRHAVMVLASASTAAKLISIASKLAELGVAKITVVCLFNRVGRETSHFVARVRRLLRGVHPADPPASSAADLAPPPEPSADDLAAFASVRSSR